MNMTDMLKKPQAYYHFVKRQQRHPEAFNIHPVRAVLVETTNEARARKLMELAQHPLLRGPEKRIGLFWFTISSLFVEPQSETAFDHKSGKPLARPEVSLEPIWALPDGSLHGLGDPENS